MEDKDLEPNFCCTRIKLIKVKVITKRERERAHLIAKFVKPTSDYIMHNIKVTSAFIYTI